jgi:hypothetical protein
LNGGKLKHQGISLQSEPLSSFILPMIPPCRIGALVLAGAAVWQLQAAEPWEQVVGNGFGDPNNRCIGELRNFKGLLYAGTIRNQGTGPAQVWRSVDGTTWSNVSPVLPATAREISSMTSIRLGGPTGEGFIYFGTTDSSGPGLYRSSNGVAWVHVNGPGSTGWQAGNNAQIGPLMTVFTLQTNLYFGTRNPNGAQLWRVPYNGNTFTKVYDFSTDGSGVEMVTCIYEWNRTLYVGTRRPGGGRIYSSTNGTTWTQNAGVGNGFGSARNTNIAAMIEFRSKLLASTHNSLTGGQLWETDNGSTWRQVIGNGFGNASNVELHRLSDSAGLGQLFVTTTTLNENSGALAEVWRSVDGTNFMQSNVSGFGVPSNNGGLPTVETFSQMMYWGGQNTNSGGRIYRTAVPPSLKDPPMDRTVLFESNITFFALASGSEPMSYQWLLNGSPIQGATSLQLTVSNAQAFDAGLYQIVLSNAGGTITGAVANLTVACPTITVNPETIPNGTKGQFYSQTFTASGGKPPYRFDVTTPTIPPGLTFSAGVLSGTPTTVSTTPHTFIVFVFDDYGCLSQRQYTISILAPPGSPSITQQPASRTNVAGTTATFTVAATGTAPLSYRWRKGGVNLNDGGRISGAQTATLTLTGVLPSDAGAYSVVVSNSIATTTSSDATLTVACPPFSFSPPVLQKGTINVQYNQTISASGGTSPYTYQLTSGSLPNGISLNSAGQLLGTPTGAGTFPFTVRATDALGCQQSQDYTLKVLPPLVIQSINVSGATVTITWAALAGETYRVQFKNDLSAGPWQNLAPDVPAVGTTASYTDTPGTGPKFYQVLLVE